jgi:CRP/FNR family transcriptional regulator
MTFWLDRAHLPALPAAAQSVLARLVPQNVPAHTLLFQPGDTVRGYVLVLSGRIDVFLVGASGRDILLYSVAPGQTCVQSTLGLLGEETYSAEAITTEPTELVLVPPDMFLGLMDHPAFRTHVFRVLADRMGQMMRIVEKVAFQRILSRLAEVLIDLADDGIVTATQADLAARVGTAREVISRRLDQLARAGLIARDRGRVRILDLPGLRQRAADPDGGAM